MTRSGLTALALASVSTLALTAAARAQPVYNWSGFYVGLNAGASWGRSDAATNVPCNDLTSPSGYFCIVGIPGDAPAVSAAGTGSLSGTGFTGGVQAGYNWQANNLVLGVELDFGAFDVGASRRGTGVMTGFNTPAGTPFTIASSVDTDWLFTARARVGWAFSNVLLYATGGLAVTNIETAHSYADTFFPAVGAWSSSSTKAGWTIGGGLEWAFARNWTVKAEYLYLDFGSVTASGVVTVPSLVGYAHAISTTTDVTAHVARAGFNFRF